MAMNTWPHLSFVVAIVSASILHASEKTNPRRPNVIVVLTDDQGAVDARCYGARDLETPNIDALAARGVRFTQFYAGAPVCSPSRAALLTGRYPLRCGLTGNAASIPNDKAGLPVGEATMAQMFKKAGYATAHVGKWHLGYTPETQPTARGFDQSLGHMSGCIDNWSHFYHWGGPCAHDLHRGGKEIFENGRYFPDLIVQESARFIRANKDKPFFLYFATNLPHYPYQPDAKWLERYKGLSDPRRLYAAFVSTMDERIGQLLQTVDDLGLRENTIIVFQSDNGHSTEARAFFGGGNAGPYRGAKFSMFEGGIRMPAIISWPRHLPEGEVRGQVAHACDWLPTLAELTGVKILNDDLDGKSLVPVLKSSRAASRHDVLHWQTGTGKDAQWAVRQGEWKLIGNAWDTTKDANGSDRIDLFLCNLTKDVGEATNVASEQTEIVKALRKLHDDWVVKNGETK